MTALVTVAIALGSNLGDSPALLGAACDRLKVHAQIQWRCGSQFYRTPPVGPPQPDYLNACVIVETGLEAIALLDVLLAIEKDLGRERGERWGPRTLDLDLLLYGDRILDQPRLQVPHPRMAERGFVLVPLAEIAPDWVHPVLQRSILALKQGVDCSEIQPWDSNMTVGSTPDSTPDSKSGSTPPQLLKQRLCYRGRKFDFEVSHFKLPNGVHTEGECIRHPGGALAVPVTSDGKLVLIKQYRFATQGWLLEFPAGTLEPEEAPEAAVKREIQEETGYLAKTWQKLGQFFLAPGYSDEIIYAYLATDLEKLETPPDQDEDEDIEVILMTPEELEQTLRSGEGLDSRIVTAYWLAKPFLMAMQS